MNQKQFIGKKIKFRWRDGNPMQGTLVKVHWEDNIVIRTDAGGGLTGPIEHGSMELVEDDNN